jgi:hypothetical protein
MNVPRRWIWPAVNLKNTLLVDGVTRLVKKVVRSDKMRQNFIGKSQVRS